ncbi:ATP-dependent DNA helicase Q4 [Extremus antarcticus]|uniref:ATP-dependent DNA helicase Q4 n=1 Tax=Extremus antarcticus TaxID=702011 RepID=A0AAJ0D4J2_9PEZI|nr:ATP-dependent DNA helicase Q4 [Extremus antarcticus]
MVHDVVREAEDMLWRKLMWTKYRERVEIPLDKLTDDVTFTKRGISFVNNGKERSRGQAGVDVDPGVRYSGRKKDAPPRRVGDATEISTVRFRNGYAQDRNVFVIHGQIVVVTRYHKSQSQLDNAEGDPALSASFQEYLSVQVKGCGWSDYVWANEKGPWETDRLTKVITREAESRLGVRLTTHDYRHTAISIGRRVVGDGFAHGYAEEMADIEEPEIEGDDALEMSAGRGGEVGMNRYGVSVDVIKHLSSRTVDTFRPLSEKWHEFLGLSSHGGTGRKRGREERSNSAIVEQEVTQEERRMVLALRKNGISGWQEAMARYSTPNATSAVADIEREGEDRGQQAEERMQVAVRKVLQCEDFSFRSKEQGEALRRIVREQDRGVLVVVLPTGGRGQESAVHGAGLHGRSGRDDRSGAVSVVDQRSGGEGKEARHRLHRVAARGSQPGSAGVR